MRSSVPPRDHRTHRRPQGRRTTSPTGPPPRGHEHRRQAGAARRVHPLRRLRLHAHRGLGRQHVTHILGVRAFGTQLLCEQVIGRALRRQSYELNEEGLFNAEYADVLGIPFDFTAKPVVAPPQPPRETSTSRPSAPIATTWRSRFPRVEGYRVELPQERLTADV